MRRIVDFVLRLRFTLILLACLALAGLVTNTYFAPITAQWLHRIGFAPKDLWYWRLERMITSAVVTSGETVFWQAIFFVALFVGLAEWMYGWKRAAATFFGVHLAALVLLSIIVLIGSEYYQDAGLSLVALARDVGPSAGYFACFGLLSSRLKPPWQWVSGATILLVFLIVILLPPDAEDSAAVEFSADLAHLLAFPLGWLSGRIHLPVSADRTPSWSDKD